MFLQKILLAFFAGLLLLPAHGDQVTAQDLEKDEFREHDAGPSMTGRIEDFFRSMLKLKEAEKSGDLPGVATGGDAGKDAGPADNVVDKGSRLKSGAESGPLTSDPVNGGSAWSPGMRVPGITAPDSQQQYRIGSDALEQNWRTQHERQDRAQLEAWLLEREAQQQYSARQHEFMRNRALSEHDYLLQNHEKLLRQKMGIANWHEEMRKQAEERRNKIAAIRLAIKDMTPAERRRYMEAHRAELYTGGKPEEYQFQGGYPLKPDFGPAYRQSPPWYRQGVPPGEFSYK